MVCRLLSTSSSTWALWPEDILPSEATLPSVRGAGISRSLKAWWPCPTPGLCLREWAPFLCSECLFQPVTGTESWAPHDWVFFEVLHCLQQSFLSTFCASCPVNCWRRYMECIILYIVLTFAFLTLRSPPKHSQNSAEFNGGTNLGYGSSNGFYFHTPWEEIKQFELQFFVYCLKKRSCSVSFSYTAFFYKTKCSIWRCHSGAFHSCHICVLKTLKSKVWYFYLKKKGEKCPNHRNC